LETSVLLERAHPTHNRRRVAYRQEARRLISHGVDPSRAERLCDAVAIGSAAFAARVRRLAAEGSLDGIEGKRKLRRCVSAEKVRRATEHLMGEPWEAFRDRYGNCGCALFLWGARRLCGLTLREAGRLVGGIPLSTVSTAIRRLEARSRQDASLRRLQDRLVEMANE
jgi:hypothetical protein